jgi:hypothetical protein
VIVIINPESTDKSLQLTGDGSTLNLVGNTVSVYTTDLSNNLKKTQSASGNIAIGSHSVVTLVGTYQ